MERVAEQLFCARAKRCRLPALLQHLRKLGDLHEAVLPSALANHIEADRALRVPGLDHDQLLAQVPVDPAFLLGNKLEQDRCRITVQIEEDEAAAGMNVLRRHMAQQHRLSAARLAEDGDVFGAFGVRDRNETTGLAAVNHCVSNLEAAAETSAPAVAQLVPGVNDDLFDDRAHSDLP